MSPLVASILREAERLDELRGQRPGMLWVGMRAYSDVTMAGGFLYAPHDGRFDQIPGQPETPRSFAGMAIHRDKWLPPDVWRLADDDGTLLFDCREGKVLA